MEANHRLSKEEMIRAVGEKIAREMGVGNPEIEINKEGNNFKVSVLERGEIKGILWIDAETGKVWGFSLNQPRKYFNDQINEFVKTIRNVLE